MTGPWREERNLALLRARNAMDRRYAEPLDVAELARVACLARSHFISAFRETFGETPHRYLQRRRVERAMHLLTGTDLTVTEICLAVGWSSLGTFSGRFTAIVGLSPTEFRAARAAPEAYVPGAFTMAWRRPAG